jgi:hypothetical protein
VKLRHRLIVAVLGATLIVTAGVALPPNDGGPDPALAAAAGAIYTCQHDGLAARNVDPIVSPGVPSDHPHIFFGAVGVTENEDEDSLRAKATRCVETANHSAYWIPVPEENGVELVPTTSKHFLGYYRCRHSAGVCANLASPPAEFEFVVGKAAATSAADNPVFNNGLGGFRCGTGGGTFYPDRSGTTCDARLLVVSTTGGNCILPDGSLSMAVNSGCTGAGGTPTFRLQGYWRFRLLDSQIGTLTIGGKPTYTLHSDYKFGWERPAFERFLDACIRRNVACSTNFNV